LRRKESPYVVGLREIPASGLQRTFDLSGDFARAALVDTEASADDARLAADVTLFKSGVEVLARGRVEGELSMVCSRCVGPAKVSVVSPIEVLYLPRDADLPGSDEDIAGELPDVVPYEDEQIDLEETLREEILLALPYAPVCSEDCKGLCPTCGKDLNEGACGCSDTPKDDRFAPLRNLKV
jgi:uncharacterized protein